ncbi:MAG: insulinase family protein [Endomicrobium sp.]|jgi:predicted Zn-dependent peptidase|nr:insulinase family protein [Endomicrobium sp.]
MGKHENGLTSILLHNKNNLCASVVVFVRVGSIDENFSQAGLSHFLEHLMFKGSKNYPGDLMSKNVENIGGEINATTSKEFTMYYISTQKDNVKESIKMLADTIANPLFPQDEIDMERKVVIEEIQRYLDKPRSVLYEKFYETIYTKSALKNSIIGQANIIANVSRKEIYDYYKTHYIPEKMIVVVSGNFDKVKVGKLIGETFGNFYTQPAPKEPVCLEDIATGKDIVEHKKVEVGYMLSGFLGPNIDEDDIYIADLATNILGGGKTSRLYKSLYENKRLVYNIDCSFSSHKGTGNICIVSVFDAKNIDTIKLEIKKQIENIINNGITQEELNRSKLSKKTSWSFSLETPLDIAETYGYWYLIGKQKFVDEYLERIESVTLDDIQNFFKEFYSNKMFSNVALLPKEM